jgi:restriction system protein
MPGRRTVFEDLIIMAAKLPWQAGLVLSLLSFISLHVIAAHFASPIVARGNGDLGATSTHALLATVARLAQFIVPPALIIGAGTSAWRRSRASALVDSAEPGETTGAKTLSWSEFEQLVAELFRRQGYAVAENLIGGPDGGVDLVLRKGNERALVQCKHWRTRRVGAPVVQELKGVMAARGISGGFVVSSGTFTDQAKAFAAEACVGLVDGPELMSIRRQLSRQEPEWSLALPRAPRVIGRRPARRAGSRWCGAERGADPTLVVSFGDASTIHDVAGRCQSERRPMPFQHGRTSSRSLWCPFACRILSPCLC